MNSEEETHSVLNYTSTGAKERRQEIDPIVGVGSEIKNANNVLGSDVVDIDGQIKSLIHDPLLIDDFKPVYSRHGGNLTVSSCSYLLTHAQSLICKELNNKQVHSIAAAADGDNIDENDVMRCNDDGDGGDGDDDNDGRFIINKGIQINLHRLDGTIVKCFAPSKFISLKKLRQVIELAIEKEQLQSSCRRRLNWKYIWKKFDILSGNGMAVFQNMNKSLNDFLDPTHEERITHFKFVEKEVSKDIQKK